MSRNDGVYRTTVRNRNLTVKQIMNAQHHNEREKSIYANPDIVPERACYNIHFKQPEASYTEVFAEMVKSGLVSTRGLKQDAKLYGELIFDVNSAYFHNHGGYEFAKRFFEDAYQAAIRIVGGEQYILSAVMHADERNKAMSESLGFDVYHYHLHVVYVPVVEKQILWTKRCKDKSLVGTVKETVMQVSSSKKWQSRPAMDTYGKPILQKNGKPILKKSYSILQDDFWKAMREAGYTDVERGERGSTEEHLTVMEFKVQQEAQRLDILNQKIHQKEAQLETARKKNAVQKALALTYDAIDQMGKKKMIGGKIEFTLEEAQELKALAKKGAAAKARITGIQHELDEEKRTSGIWKRRYEILREESREYIAAKEKSPENTKRALRSILEERHGAVNQNRNRIEIALER